MRMPQMLALFSSEDVATMELLQRNSCYNSMLQQNELKPTKFKV